MTENVDVLMRAGPVPAVPTAPETTTPETTAPETTTPESTAPEATILAAAATSPTTRATTYPSRRARHDAEGRQRTATRRPPRPRRTTRAMAGRAPARSRGKHFTLIGLGFAITLIATYALPANAQPTKPTHDESSVVAAAPQVVPVSTGQRDAVVRDGYTVTAAPKPPPPPPPAAQKSQAASVGGPGVQWPFPMPVRISSGFGYRDSPCSGCSSAHQGLDLNPGAGTPIRAIANGVVKAVGNPSGGFGVYATIDHDIDGQRVSSLYAHMAYGSLMVSIGDTVALGELLGQVGSTGASTGPHLHLEIHINGTPTDPYSWMTAHVG